MLNSILNLGSTILDKIFPDAGERDKAKLRLLELQQAGELKTLEADLQIAIAQTEVNKVEAASPDLFRGGWRPYIGWVCGAALSYHYIARPIISGLWQPMPPIDLGDLWPLLLGMLGLGGFRTYERVKGS